MKRLLPLLGFLILLSPAAWSIDDLMTRQMVDQAREWTQKGRDDLAAPVWRKMLSLEPGHPEALIKLGLIEVRAGNLKEAQSLYQRATRLTPSPKGLGALSKALYPVEEILPTTKSPVKVAPTESIKKEVLVKVRESLVKPKATDRAPEVIREAKTSTGKWADQRLRLEKAAQDHPSDARRLLALARHLTQRETTRREAIRQLDALNGSSLRSSEIKATWKKALLDISPQQGDQALFKSYLTRHPGSTSVLRRLNALDGKETVKSSRKTGGKRSDHTVQPNSQSSNPSVNPACNNLPCK
jgi:cellulose synthase operon protein C